MADEITDLTEQLSKSSTSADNSTQIQGGNGSSKAPLARRDTSSESKKCWICFCDSTEDVPGSASPWRTPCPCALTAHETCLLDWIADLEAPPDSSSQTRHRKNKIECPQCKAEIKVARPWSPVVAGVRAAERVSGAFVVPGIATVLVGGVFSACFVHGAVSVILVVGPKEWDKLVGMTDGRLVGPGLRLIFGLPMIPVALVLSRTKMADGFLPVLPFLFFAPQFGARRWHRLVEVAGVSSSGRGEALGMGYDAPQLWPPSIEAAFLLLPYIRAMYNAAYTAVFARKEREWVRAVQREPRPGESEEQVDQPLDVQEGDMEIQAEIIFNNDNIDDNEDQRDPVALQAALDDAFDQARHQRGDAGIDTNDNRPQRLDQVQAQARARAQAQGHDHGQGQGQGQERGQEQGQEQRRQNRNPENGLILSASRIADAVLGALCFPAVASAMGEVMKLSLPAKFTTVSQVRRPGLLHTKWGRSIVGGCLFVVMKDALVLYSRYRLAQDHKKRRVLDYDGPRGRSSESV